MSPNAPRLALALGIALALPAGAQATGTLRAEFQNEAYPTSGYSGTTDVTITLQNDPDGDENGNSHSRPELFGGRASPSDRAR